MTLERLLRQVGGELRALVAKRVPRELGVSADEVEQDVRLRLWRAVEKQKTLINAAYVYRAVLSVIVDHVRRRRDLDIGQLPEGALAVAPERAVEQGARAAEIRAALIRVMARLPAPRQRPVAMHLQGFDLAQIARALGESEASVRNLVYRGLDDLRALLRAEGFEDE